ncbi:MAG: glycerate kinase [Saprospiraceae bacterium]
MRILIASDAFKDALSAEAVCEALAKGAATAMPDAQLDRFPLADGGEGTAAILQQALGLVPREIMAADPMRRPRKAVYYLSPDGKIAFVEMAATAGLQLLPKLERNPMYTSTFGTGLMVADAIQNGAEELVLAIGGSSTNDAGMGLAKALGWTFYDQHNRPLDPMGMNLEAVERIEKPDQDFALRVRVICDVQNPLSGPNGAARVYGPQKGAKPEEVELLDRGLIHFAHKIETLLDRPNLSATPGAGAAGGMGFGALAFLKASLEPGVEMVMDLCHFDEALDRADLVWTGEGMIDAQTKNGKLISGICKRAAARSIPVWGFCGRLDASPSDLQSIGLERAFCINEGLPDMPLEEKLSNTAVNLERMAREVLKNT